MNDIVQQIHAKSSLCTPTDSDHYRACLAAAEVISKYHLEQEFASQYFKITLMADSQKDMLNTSARKKSK